MRPLAMALALALAALAWQGAGAQQGGGAAGPAGPAGAAGPAGDSAGAGEPAPAPPVLRHREELLVKDTAEPVPPVPAVIDLPVPLLLLPLSVEVIGAPLFEQQDARVLGDALKNASGVGVHTESGAADFFVLRGLDSESSALVLTDGAPEPVTTFYQLYNVERVEVLKGPASFLYGGNPLAGAVDLVRKQPLRGDGFVDLAAQGGSFGTREGTVDSNWGDADGRMAMRVNGLWRATDGWRDGRGGSVWGVNPVFSWRPQAGDGSLVASFERVEDSYKPDAGLPLVGNQVAQVPASRSYQSPFDRSDQGLTRLQLDWQGKVGAVTLQDKAYYRSLSWTSDGTLLDGVFPDPTGSLQVARSLVLLADRQAFWGNRLEAGGEVNTGPVRHQLLGGLELARRDDRYTLDVGALPAIALAAPVETAAGPVPLIPGAGSAGDTRMTIAAPYFLDRLAVAKRFQLLAGARFDHLDYHDPVNATVRHDSQLSPMAGAVFLPRDGWSLYANAGRGFAPPSTRVVGPRRPETGTEEEAGVKADLAGGRWRGALAVYDLTRRNQAIPDANGFTEQAGSERSRGVELELTGHWMAGLAGLAGLEARFTYAYDHAVFTRFAESVLVAFEPPTFAVFDRTGNAPPLAPAHIVTLWLSHDFGGGWDLGAGGRYVSRQFIAADNAFAIPGAFTADASLSLPLGPLQGRIDLKNLTGTRTYTRGLGTTSIIPASGFAVYAGIAARWAMPRSNFGQHM
ncbi:MAG TPA: TonB-dependent receptor [Thermoanaerobaculia bacterium]|nr:TonB-dependent receptor [Thermoanaerobaculia bacterium]